MAGEIPITGLGQLGSVLAQSAADYTNRQQSLSDEQRRRNERLQDVQSGRDYETRQYDRQRSNLLSDEQRRRVESVADAKTKAALEARFKLINEAMSRGLITADQLGVQAAEDAAIMTLTKQLAKEQQFSQGQPENAQARLTQLSDEEKRINAQLDQVQSALSAQPTVDPRAIQQAALQIATQNNGGKTPSNEQIQAAAGEARQAAEQRALQEWYQQKEEAKIQFQTLSNQLNTIRQQQGDLIRTFKVAPGASPLAPSTPPPVATAPVPTRTGSPLSGFLDSLNTQMTSRGVQPSPAANPNTPSVGDMTSALRTAPAPAAAPIRQARTNLIADQIATLDAPRDDIDAKLADVGQKISRVQSGLDPFQGVDPAQFSGSAQVAGEMLTRLLQEQAMLQRQKAEAERVRSAGKASILSPLMQTNTPQSSTPYVPPSPGSILSTPSAPFSNKPGSYVSPLNL